jgi:peptide deformylase
MKIVTKIKKLRKISQETDLPQAQKILKKLHNMMNELGATCMGLSAIQIGIPKRVIHINYRGKVIMDLINPEIIKFYDKGSDYKEGCLSLPDTMKPGQQIIINRPKKIKLKFMDAKGNTRILKFDAIIGRAIQHEMDHLDGKLIIDYVEEK